MAISESEYISSCTELSERLARVCNIIKLLEDQQLSAVSNADVEEYRLDDGQTVIKTVYRSPEVLAKAINAYEQIANRIHAKLTGTRILRLADAKSIRHENG